MNPAKPRSKRALPRTARGGVLGRIGETLGLRGIKSEWDLASVVEGRLPVKALRSLTKHGVKHEEIYHLVIPRRTLTHRIARKERLTQEESDRALRIARTVALADEVFGSGGASLGWLREPKRRFDQRSPISLLTTDAGARLVEEFLYQIDHGMPG